MHVLRSERHVDDALGSLPPRLLPSREVFVDPLHPVHNVRGRALPVFIQDFHRDDGNAWNSEEVPSSCGAIVGGRIQGLGN